MSALGFSFINSNDSKNIEQTSTRKHCRTLRKKHKKKSSKIDNLINSLSTTQQQMKEGFEGNRSSPSRGDCEGEEECDLGNFEPLASGQNNISKDSYNVDPLEPLEEGAPVTTENFAQLGEVTSSDYYKQYVPYYSQLQGSQAEVHTDKDALMTKLNYMIHLLEEQQDEKTDNVTEELVLYLFLGVFVIFVVDSFARVGKYTR